MTANVRAEQPTTPTAARRGRGHGESGAVLVEFALVFPVLALILFGIIEFGWAFSQHLDVRHGAREAARLAVVDFTPDPALSAEGRTQAIVAETCGRMSPTQDTTVELSLKVAGEAGIGDVVVVQIERPLDTLTGFIDFALGGVVLTSTVEMRLEQPANWAPEEGPLECS